MIPSLEPLGGGMGVYTLKNSGVTTDSILLANFIRPVTGKKLCDFGTGCGIIPLLLFRLHGGYSACGVEIQSETAELCRKSIAYNKLEERFSVLNCDLTKLGGILPGNSFDAVSMNPPYKQAGSGEESPDEARRAARHEQGCTYADIAGAAFRILKPAGSFYICHRAERLPEIVAATERAGLYVKRLRMVHTRADSPSKLFLMEARKGVNPGMTAEPPLILYGADEKYSAEASEIYGFYGENKR